MFSVSDFAHLSVCIYCDTILDESDIRVCLACGEYDGVMAVDAYADYLGESAFQALDLEAWA